MGFSSLFRACFGKRPNRKTTDEAEEPYGYVEQEAGPEPTDFDDNDCDEGPAGSVSPADDGHTAAVGDGLSAAGDRANNAGKTAEQIIGLADSGDRTDVKKPIGAAEEESAMTDVIEVICGEFLSAGADRGRGNRRRRCTERRRGILRRRGTKPNPNCFFSEPVLFVFTDE